MPTNLETAVESYLRARNLSRGTSDEYRSTLRKWNRWGGGVPIEELARRDIREFLNWVYENAVHKDGTNPGTYYEQGSGKPMRRHVLGLGTRHH